MKFYKFGADLTPVSASPCPGNSENTPDRVKTLESLQKILRSRCIDYAEYQALSAVMLRGCVCEDELALIERIHHGIQQGIIAVS
ncbi:MAG: hypothetical protein HC838_09840 [Spirulinaceae cyanobacterium RM2_2_10]|nr:hypothetical protein [Spirulinaceae cyanobacterium SM2_1_0]NJO20274.1 hypothetical protein [Spirulinaceae cyanobacterium RM2_2_10]